MKITEFVKSAARVAVLIVSAPFKFLSRIDWRPYFMPFIDNPEKITREEHRLNIFFNILVWIIYAATFVTTLLYRITDGFKSVAAASVTILCFYMLTCSIINSFRYSKDPRGRKKDQVYNTLNEAFVEEQQYKKFKAFILSRYTKQNPMSIADLGSIIKTIVQTNNILKLRSVEKIHPLMTKEFGLRLTKCSSRRLYDIPVNDVLEKELLDALK